MADETPDSDSEESPDSKAPPVLEVKVTNPTEKPKPKWNDECDDERYNVIVLTDKEKDI